ncbi:MAG: glycosyltransferase family 9 protein [Candidatus Woesearchaeota archaeon]
MNYKIKSKLKYLMLLIDIIGYILFSPLAIYNRLFRKIKNPKTIFLIKNDFIGDTIMITSFVRNLKENYPDSKIFIGCRAFSMPVFDNNPHVEKVFELNTPWLARGAVWSYKQVFSFLKTHFRKYDLVFDLHTEPRNIMLGFLIGKSIVSYGYRGFGFLLTKKCVTDWRNSSIVEQNLDLLRGIGLKVKNPYLELFLTKKEIANAEKTFNSLHLDSRKKTIGLHTGVSDPFRQWPLEKFRELAKLLMKKYNIIILDEDLERGEKASKGLAVANLSGKTPLRDFFAVVSCLDILVGLESLSGWVAAASDIPIVSIHSSTTNPNVMGVYAKKKKIIFKKSICKHCNQGFCPKDDSIKLIPVQEVHDAVLEMMGDKK